MVDVGNNEVQAKSAYVHIVNERGRRCRRRRRKRVLRLILGSRLYASRMQGTYTVCSRA